MAAQMGEGLGDGAVLLQTVQGGPMSGQQNLPLPDAQNEPVRFVPTRAAGLARLDRFVSRAGRHYTGLRNYDLGPDQRSNVSALSPWIRHRVITEEEVLRATLARHSPSAADKFIQEVFWRSYFKGWLEQHPSVWAGYLADLDDLLADLESDDWLAKGYRAATVGETGIEGFDDWSRELVETRYLHNHARMWFASIWIFTLRLPWQLGADFFLRHLLDGDPASNTLSWRWVAGLHTKGKAYQARVSNIAKYTRERFRPKHFLASEIRPLEEDAHHPRVPLPGADPLPEGSFLLLLTEDDCSIAQTLPRPPAAVLGLLASNGRSPLGVSAKVSEFAHGAVDDALSQSGGDIIGLTGEADWSGPILRAAAQAGVRSIVIGHPPIGPVATRFAQARGEIERAGLRIHAVRRDYDSAAWPHATRGFFALKKKIPALLRDIGLSG
jgi:deoxyribodipyrimidine photo-lyase